MKLTALFLMSLAACSSRPANNDQPDASPHSALGTGNRLRDVQNPTSPLYAGTAGNVNVSSVVVTTIDTFDETKNGKSIGTIFVQDVDQATGYDGVSLYSPTFIPGNLRLAPGDVISMTGQYSEQATIGTTVTFPAGSFLPQMNKPQVTQSYEVQVPQPAVVTVADLDTFATGRQWIGMLVTINDVTVGGTLANSNGRVTAPFDNVTNGLEINNELFDLQAWTGTNTASSFAPGTHFKSITGIVDFFFNIYICPRSMADLQQ